MSLTYLSGENYSLDLHDKGTRTVYICILTFDLKEIVKYTISSFMVIHENTCTKLLYNFYYYFCYYY